MRLVTAASLVFALSASMGFAQALPPAQGTPPAQPPATTTPAPTPAPATPAPPAPFPAGAKIGVVNLQQIAALSAEGKAATGRINALAQRKQTEVQQRAKALADNQTKLQQTGALMNEAARTALERDIDRMTREGERFQQDAQAELTELQTELQNEFNRKLFPILQQIAQEKELHLLLSAQDAGAIWWEPGTDLTLEAVKRLDALTPPARPAAAPGAATPPAAAPAPVSPAPAPAPAPPATAPAPGR
jgi:Skp family chaperone for outer membrane proteins